MEVWKVVLLMTSCASLCWAVQEPHAVVVHPDGEPADQDNGVTVENEASDEVSIAEAFIPTEEWQTIKPGQAIPKGLHVRVNLQTGEKEAKLMDGAEKVKITSSENPRATRLKEEIEKAMQELENAKKEGTPEQDLKYWKLGGREGVINKKSKTFSRQELKDALKKFKATSSDFTEDQDCRDGSCNKFRKMEDIKEDFSKMKVGIKTDLEILRQLHENYKRSDLSIEERIQILTDLEYYLHQIDNAQDFAEMGGLQLVIRDLNHTEPQVRSEAAFVLGSALQSNPKVQIKVIQEGCMQWLIHMLVTEQHAKTRTRVMYALSSFVRHFPIAQEKFVRHGGLTALGKLFSEVGTEKLQVKAITLVTDLLMEKKTILESHNPEDSFQKEKVRQYKMIPLLETLLEQGWCDLIPKLLETQEHDMREKVLTAMTTLLPECKSAFVKSVVVLKTLEAEYEHLSQEEKQEAGGDSYFKGLHRSVGNIISVISTKDEL